MNAPVKLRAARGVAVGVMLTALFAFFFVYPAHDPEPNGLPVAVVAGPGNAPVRAILEQRGFDVVRARDEAEARRLIGDREVYGALNTDGSVLVSSAASFVVAQLLREMSNGEAVDVRALDADDPRGTALNLTVLPLMITSILAVLILGQLAPELTGRARLQVSVLAALLAGIALIAVVAVALGALPGSFLALAGIAALGILSVGLPAGGIIRLLGPPGVGVAFMLFLMLGVPASGTATAPELLPTPWAEGGQFLQAGAIGSALRGATYFDGAAITVPLVVLAAWAAIGGGLHVLADRRQSA